MNYNWKVDKDEINNTISVTLEVALRKCEIGQPLPAGVKVGCVEAMNYIRKNGYKFGKMIKNATVTNRSEENCCGTWIFELPAAAKPEPKQAKRTTPRKKKAPSPPPSGALTDD